MSDDLHEHWTTACDAVAAAQGIEDADGALRRFTDHAGAHDSSRAPAVALLTDALDACDPWEAIAYSFHVLRWPELVAALEERRDVWLSNPRTMNEWGHLRDAFNPDWEDRDMFPSLRR